MPPDKKTAGTKMCDYFLHCGDNTLGITINGMDEKGQLTFSFLVSDIKDAKAVEVVGQDGSGIENLGFFYTDMMGNLIVRKNLKKFWEFFVTMSDADYTEKLTKYDHLHFGLSSDGRYITMVFHCSLLYDIFIRMVDNCVTGT